MTEAKNDARKLLQTTAQNSGTLKKVPTPKVNVQNSVENNAVATTATISPLVTQGQRTIPAIGTRVLEATALPTETLTATATETVPDWDPTKFEPDCHGSEHRDKDTYDAESTHRDFRTDKSTTTTNSEPGTDCDAAPDGNGSTNIHRGAEGDAHTYGYRRANCYAAADGDACTN